MRAVRFANWVLKLAAAAFLLVFAYVIYRYPLGTGGVSTLFYAGPVLGGLAAIVLLWLPPAGRVNVALVLVSGVVAVYAAELFLTLRSGDSQYLEGAAGKGFDERTKYQVVQDLRRQGTRAYPAALPSFFMRFDSAGSLLPLGGLANTTTVLCNELGEYAIYQSDEHGFNNPAGLWRSDSLDVAVVGDSFTHGSCVPPGADLVSRIRERWPATVSLGMSDNGPLFELATIREFLPAFRPDVVLWMYFEGNDLSDLDKERVNPRLMRYMEEGFHQGLVGKQAAVDSSLVSWIEEEAKAHADAPATSATDRSPVAALRRFATLQTLRRSLGLVANPPLSDANCELPTFRRVLSEAERTVSSWGGRLYFVYLPSWGRYHSTPNRCEQLREQVLETARGLDLPVIDLHPVLAGQQNRSALFAQGSQRATHYNVEGYDLVARAVIAAVEANERQSRSRTASQR